jgi:hypothetical protein
MNSVCCPRFEPSVRKRKHHPNEGKDIKQNDSMRNPEVMNSVESGKRQECNIGFTTDVLSQSQGISLISRCVKFAEAFHFFVEPKWGHNRRGLFKIKCFVTRTE